MQIGMKGLGGSACTITSTPAPCIASLPPCTQDQLMSPTWALDSMGVWYDQSQVTSILSGGSGDMSQMCNPGAANAGSSGSLIPGISNTMLGIGALAIGIVIWMGVK